MDTCADKRQYKPIRSRGSIQALASQSTGRCAMDIESMERLARRFVTAIESSDRAALEAIYAPEAVVWHNYNNADQSRADNIAAIANHPKLFKLSRSAAKALLYRSAWSWLCAVIKSPASMSTSIPRRMPVHRSIGSCR
jgi:hypothetical protein